MYIDIDIVTFRSHLSGHVPRSRVRSSCFVSPRINFSSYTNCCWTELNCMFRHWKRGRAAGGPLYLKVLEYDTLSLFYFSSEERKIIFPQGTSRVCRASEGASVNLQFLTAAFEQAFATQRHAQNALQDVQVVLESALYSVRSFCWESEGSPCFVVCLTEDPDVPRCIMSNPTSSLYLRRTAMRSRK